MGDMAMARRPRRAVIAILALLTTAGALLLLGAADAAFAASPIDLGPTDDTGPYLALTPSGAAALAYTTTEQPANNAVLHYCRIDPGAGGCSAATTFANPTPTFNEDLGFAALADGSTVRVVESRRKAGAEENKLLWSGEPFGGATGLGTSAGQPGSYLRFGQAVLAPSGTLNPTSATIATIETGPNSSGGPIVAASGTAAGSGPPSKFHVTADSTGDSAIGVAGNVLAAAWTDQSQGNKVFWRRYTGTEGTAVAIQNGANWGPATFVAAGNGATPEVRFASGPAGLYLAHIRPTDDAVVVQQLSALGVGPEVAVTNGGTYLFAISEDPAGLLHVAWRNAEGAFYHYAKDASNTIFSNPQTLPESDYREMQIATTAAGTGWLTWWDDGTDHSYALPLAPGEPTTPTPTAPTPTPSPVAPAPPKSAAPPKSGPAPKVVIFGSLGHGLVGSLTVPKECVPGGSVFKAKVAVKRKGSAAHKASYTVKGVAFLLGSKTISTDRSKPFEVGFATKGVKAGAALSVGARISVVLRKGRRHSTVSKTLKATVTTCR